MDNKYYCYILRSLNINHLNKTYNGSTNNIKRRLKQHNGIISGGAKSTKGKGEWIPYVIIEGFETHNESLSCEWKIKHPTNKKKRPGQYNGIKGRVKSLNLLYPIQFKIVLNIKIVSLNSWWSFDILQIFNTIRG